MVNRELLVATEKLIPALRSLCELASSNFPANTDLTISCHGDNATVTMRIPHFVLADLLPSKKSA